MKVRFWIQQKGLELLVLFSTLGEKAMFTQGFGTAGRGFGETTFKKCGDHPLNFREIQRGPQDVIVIKILKI